MGHHLRESAVQGDSARDRGSLTLKAAAGQGAPALLLLSAVLADSPSRRVAPLRLATAPDAGNGKAPPPAIPTPRHILVYFDFSQMSHAAVSHSIEGARRSIKTLEDLMPALAAIEGRKALVLFTGALRDEPGVQYLSLAHSSPAAVGITLAADLLRLTREANAAGVSVYTIHSGGLDNTELNLANESRAAEVTVPDKPPSPVALTLSTNKMAAILDMKIGDLADTRQAARAWLYSAHALRKTLTTETGGRALQRTNGLAAILNTARQDLSCCYLIGYRHAGRGDGGRHDLVLALKPRPGGDSRRELAPRYRSYFTDSSAEERRARLLRSALTAPEISGSIPVTTDASDLALEGVGHRVLIKMSVPLEALSLPTDGKGGLRGGVHVEGGMISPDDARETACGFRQEISLEIPPAASNSSGKVVPTGLVLETGCILNPGTYAMTVAALDSATQAVGARRATITIQPTTIGEPAVEEVHLWTRDPGLIAFASGAERIGVGDAQGEARFVPMSRRRMATGQEALLTFLLCLPRDIPPPAATRSPAASHRELSATASTRSRCVSMDPSRAEYWPRTWSSLFTDRSSLERRCAIL